MSHRHFIQLHWILDIVGLLPVSMEDGHEYKKNLSIIDIGIRWVELIPLHERGRSISDIVDDYWLSRYPRPAIVLSDQGQKFKSWETDELLRSYGIKHHFTTTYSATGNSIIERSHGTINNMIRCLGVDNWHTELQSVAFAMRPTVHSSLGVTNN